MREPIRGKVARILNSRELALNIGALDGVVVGMVFEVLDPRGEDIRDPDTGDILGSLRRPKVTVRTVQVEERVSLASTFKWKNVNVGGQAAFDVRTLGKLFEGPRYVTKYETLRAADHGKDVLDEEDSIVKVGDPVVQVIRQSKSQNADTEVETSD